VWSFLFLSKYLTIGMRAFINKTKAPGLHALYINPVSAAAADPERLVGLMRGLLPASARRSMEEPFSGACTVEFAG
jgi:hypothetical protein